MRRLALVFLLLPLALPAQIAIKSPRAVGVAPRQAVPPPPPTPTADLATLEGQVFNALGGSPLRKAIVNLNRINNGPLPAGARGNYSATSDASGRYAISGIEPGTYRVNANHIGFLNMEYNARRPGGPGTRLDLARAQKMTGVDFRLSPHGVISGKITDEDGDPLQGVQLQLWRLAYDQGKKTLLSNNNGATNDLGEFRLSGIVPGKYYLGALHYGGRAFAENPAAAGPQEDYVTIFFPGATDIAAATPLEVGPGDQMQGINLRLTKMHTVRVKGRVVNNVQPQPQPQQARPVVDGAVLPISNTVVQVRIQSRVAGNINGMNVNTQVRPDGTFEFPSVAPGSYNLIALSLQPGKVHFSRQAVEVGNTNLEGINLAINPGIMVSGHVRYEGDAPASPPALSVRLMVQDNSQGLASPQPAKVDADGNFRFDDVNAELYNVTCGTPQGYYVKAIRAGSTDVLVSGLDLTNGAGTLDILLGANPPQVGGTVQNTATQQPATAVTVVLIPQEKERQGQSFFYASNTTDQYGAFTFNRVMPGEYKAYAWEDVVSGSWFDPAFMKTFEGKGESVSAREGSPVNVKLTMIPAK